MNDHENDFYTSHYKFLIKHEKRHGIAKKNL